VIALVPLENRFGRQQLLAVTTILWTGLAVLFAATTHLLLAIVLAATLGFIYTMFLVTTNTSIQTHTDDAYRGRVMALWSLNRFAFAPLSGLLLGALATWIGTPLTLALCGVLGFVVILLIRPSR
jgi:MFS family permease